MIPMQGDSLEHRRARPLDQPERRAMLLRCAVRVFARRGIGAARHAEIAREAKVSVPTVFFYFPTREALVREVLNEVARFFEAMTERIHASSRPAPEIVLEHGHAFLDAMEKHPEYTRVFLEWSTAMREEVWPLYLQTQEKQLAIITETIRRWRSETGRGRVEDAEDDARVMAATAYMLAQMSATRVPGPKVERFLRTAIRDTLGE